MKPSALQVWVEQMHYGEEIICKILGLPFAFLNRWASAKKPKPQSQLHNYSALEKKNYYSVTIVILIQSVSMQLCSHFAKGI